MSDRVYLVNLEPPELRVAELRNDKLFDLDIERDVRMLGNIYLGRVENVLPGMDAAFVDIGQKRNALLYVGDAVPDGSKHLPVGSVLKSNQSLILQVARPAIGAKGARVTTRVSLPGRYCILISNSESAGVSKRIEREEERTRLRRIADKLRPLDHGLILRTEAEGATEAQISTDIAQLGRQLEAVKRKAESGTKPRLLHRDLGLLGRLARDRLSSDVGAVYLDSMETADALKEQMVSFAPELVERLHYYSGPTPIFEHFGIKADVAMAGKRQVPLPRGGTLVIDEAEALTAIDVNTGSFVGKRGLEETVVQTNLEAVEEITRQLRLRDIGGIVVIDFIDMDRTRDRVKVLNALESALKADRAKTRIVQISPSGLVEMTRRRENHTLRSLLCWPCPNCEGLGYVLRTTSVAIDARRQARELAQKNAGATVLVRLHPETACEFLGEEAEYVRDLESATGSKIMVRVNASLDLREFHFERLASGIALTGDLVPGAIYPINSATPRYPASSPLYLAVGQTLVQVEGWPEDTTETSLLLHITEVGKHFAVGRISGR